MRITKCYRCKNLEKTEKASWYYCPVKDLKIHWNWAVNPPSSFPEIRYCEHYTEKKRGNFVDTHRANNT